MARSSEYPDLTWIAPASWTAGRPTGQPSLIVVHTTEGSEGTTSAENGALYDARRTDGTSTHYFHDQDTTVQCVLTWNTAHTAGYTGNRKGIQHELCGRAGQGPNQWLDAASEGTIRQAAKQCARDAKKYGIPVRKLSVAQVRAGERGFCGHADVSYAWGEVDHTDPGPNFPWNRFINLVNQYMNPAPTVEIEESDMSFQVIPVPAGFAYDANGVRIGGNESTLSIPLPPAGHKDAHVAWNTKRLHVSLAGDHAGAPGPRVRVAVNNGAGWTISTVDVASGPRESDDIKVPAAATAQGYNVTIGRVTTDVAEHATLPLSVLIEIV